MPKIFFLKIHSTEFLFHKKSHLKENTRLYLLHCLVTGSQYSNKAIVYRVDFKMPKAISIC